MAERKSLFDARHREFLDEVRGRILACVGDQEGRLAVERGRMLSLTAGQVAALAEALQMLDLALAEESA